VRARIVRYVHELDAQTLRLLAERLRRQTDGVVERPFVSLPGDALSRGGYWRALPNDSIIYYAPDADVLLSPAFARDHCFGVADGRGERAGLTGLTFEPAAEREVPDVRGTIWLDTRTFELRLVEFRYSRLPVSTSNRNVGGEVQFARVRSGAWIVARWFIRVPRYANRPTTRSTGVPGQRPIVSYSLTALIEEGGTVTVDTASARTSDRRRARSDQWSTERGGSFISGRALAYRSTLIARRSSLIIQASARNASVGSILSARRSGT
jgi:hypothetical protein